MSQYQPRESTLVFQEFTVYACLLVYVFIFIWRKKVIMWPWPIWLGLIDSPVSAPQVLRLQAWVNIPRPRIHHNFFNPYFYIAHDYDKQLQVSYQSRNERILGVGVNTSVRSLGNGFMW